MVGSGGLNFLDTLKSTGKLLDLYCGQLQKIICKNPTSHLAANVHHWLQPGSGCGAYSACNMCGVGSGGFNFGDVLKSFGKHVDLYCGQLQKKNVEKQTRHLAAMVVEIGCNQGQGAGDIQPAICVWLALVGSIFEIP